MKDLKAVPTVTYRACLQAASLLVAITLVPNAQAQTQPKSTPTDNGEIIVTASRTEQALQTAPVGATVITRAQIEAAGVVDANEAIRKIGGVVAKTDFYGGREYTLDLRGFGSTANENTVVLIDGVRISENEQTSARLSSIAANNIERIEILRGGASVMWGEGATSGVINIITRSDRKKGLGGTASASLSSFGTHEGVANVRIGTGSASFDASARSLASSGYRHNSAVTQDVASLGFSLKNGDTTFRTRMDQEALRSRLPGGLKYSEYALEPRTTTKASEYANINNSRFTAGVDQRLGNWLLTLDGGSKTREFSPYQSSNLTNYRAYAQQLSPKAVFATELGGTNLSLTAGVDTHRWRYTNDRGFDANGTTVKRAATQTNRASYIMTDWLFPSQTRIVGGVRSETVVKSAADTGGLGATYLIDNKVSASEFAINQTILKGVDIYARVAKSYRLANVDDFTSTDTKKVLKPQDSRDKELGLKVRQGAHAYAVRYFMQDTINEIYNDSTANGGNGANINIDPTKRQGIEIQAASPLTSNLIVGASLQAMSAKFAGGANVGKRIPLTNNQTATVRVNYKFNEYQNFEAAWRLLSEARVGNDDSNTCQFKVPASRVLDVNHRMRSSANTWEFTLGVNNLTNQRYYIYDYNWGCSATGGSVYPELPRNFRAALKYSF